MSEVVVCIPNALIDDGIHMAGSNKFHDLMDYIGGCRFSAVRDKTDKSSTSLEFNTSVRQLVVCALIQDGDDLLIYRRKNKTGEKRLAGYYSLPSGHMNAFTKNFHADIVDDTLREVTEELNLTPIGQEAVFSPEGATLPMKVCALFQTSSPEDNGVHLVHTGLLIKIDVTDKFKVSLKETGSMEELTRVNSNNYSEYLKECDLWLRLTLPWFSQLILL